MESVIGHANALFIPGLVWYDEVYPASPAARGRMNRVLWKHVGQNSYLRVLSHYFSGRFSPAPCKKTGALPTVQQKGMMQ